MNPSEVENSAAFDDVHSFQINGVPYLAMIVSKGKEIVVLGLAGVDLEEKPVHIDLFLGPEQAVKIATQSLISVYSRLLEVAPEQAAVLLSQLQKLVSQLQTQISSQITIEPMDDSDIAR